MSDDNAGSELDRVTHEAAVSITTAVAVAFDELWERDDAAEIAAGFMAGEIALHLTRNGLLILREPPATGAGVPDTPECLGGDVE